MTKHCNRCGETPASLREYEDYKGNKASFYHCDACATQAYRYFRQETRDHQRAQEEAKKRKEQAEQAQKDREYKLFHCQQCGKKSSLYHYIYDKRTGKLTSSTGNATDANNQIVFCTKEHFQAWLNKHKAKIAEALRRKGQKLEEQNEILEDLIAKQEELRRLLAEELEKETPTIICTKCGQNKEGKHWINKQDQNAFCSESCYDDYYATEKCDACGLKITGKSYYNDYENKTGTLCQDCAEKKILADLGKKQDPSSPPPNNPPNYSPLNNSPPTSSQSNQSNIKCYNCKKYFGDNAHYFPQEPNKKWCDACNPEMETCFQATQQIFQNQAVNIDNLNISTENKEQLKALAKIKKGEPVDVDNLNIDEESKKELKEIQKQLSANNPSLPKPNVGDKYASVCLDCKKEWSHNHIPTHCSGCQSKNIKVYDARGQEQVIPTDNKSYLSWIVGVTVAVIMLVPYLIWRHKKVKAMKKAAKKVPWWY